MMLSKLAVRRLTKLADHMDALPRKAVRHFNMDRFFLHKGVHMLTVSPATALARFDCGTAACAFGFACTIPAFRRAGLMLDDTGSHGNVYFKNLSGRERLAAAALFFDISGDAAMYLFEANKRHELRNFQIKTPKQWAMHCRKFIQENT